MSAKQRQGAILAVLLVVLGGLWVRPFLVSGSGPGRSLRSSSARAVVIEQPDQVELLDLELLERKPATFRPGRDPFRFEAAPRPAPKKAPPRPAPVAAKPAVAPPADARPPQPPKPQPPPVDFSFLGSFGPDGRRIAVFTDQAEIYNAQVGELVKERFVVREIGYESADIGFVEFPEVPPQRLAIGG